MSDWIKRTREIIHDCTFPEYTFNVEVSRTGAVYLQASYLDADTTTGTMELQFTDARFFRLTW